MYVNKTHTGISLIFKFKYGGSSNNLLVGYLVTTVGQRAGSKYPRGDGEDWGAAARGSARRRDARRPATTRPVSSQQPVCLGRDSVPCRVDSRAEHADCCGRMYRSRVFRGDGSPSSNGTSTQTNTPSRHLISKSHVLLNYCPLTSNPLSPPHRSHISIVVDTHSVC